MKVVHEVQEQNEGHIDLIDVPHVSDEDLSSLVGVINYKIIMRNKGSWPWSGLERKWITAFITGHVWWDIAKSTDMWHDYGMVIKSLFTANPWLEQRLRDSQSKTADIVDLNHFRLWLVDKCGNTLPSESRVTNRLF